jgi:phytoene dehydrogenase-like protein
LEKRDYDAIVVGSGPNGFAAAIRLQSKGLRVLLIEGADTIGGGMRTKELTLPGFRHDVCSAIHPLAAASPFFFTLGLDEHGLEFVYPDVHAAHPLDDGTAAQLTGSVFDTASLLGVDGDTYRSLVSTLSDNWSELAPALLGPLRIPSHPLLLAQFGLKGIQSATTLSKRFKTREARALFAGMAAHAIQPLTNIATSAIALVLLAAGNRFGWPVPLGGSDAIADSLAKKFISLGGVIQTGFFVRKLDELPSAHAVLFDVTPRQLLSIAGHKFSSLYRWQLERYRYGMGVFKIDWALDGPIPFTAEACRKAPTVHLGNTMEEIVAGEELAANGGHPERPFVLLAQQSIIDPSRAPEGKHTAWAYCHVPNGSTRDMTNVIELQVERFAPGFRERILAKHTYNSIEMEAYNPNYIGGDINGGVIDIGQLFTRPVLRASPYTTSAKGIYICSSSTPPGGGVHGMCGFHAAGKALKQVFDIQP